MILGEEKIREYCERRGAEPFVSPFRPDQLNPSSYDLRLGDEACVYVTGESVAASYAERLHGLSVVSPTHLPPAPGWLDAKQHNPSLRFRLSEAGFRVEPGRIYLMHTEEVVAPGLNHVAVVDGKSSLGRLGLIVHATAGYIDPGFRGQVTLEVAALGEPVRVHPGMRIAQVRFSPLLGECRSYAERGHYTGEASMGPVPSRSYQQFERAPLKTEPAPPPVEECGQVYSLAGVSCNKPQGHAGPCG